jgi:cold shock CspA family protein
MDASIATHLGVVSLKKKSFGFLRCVEASADVLFHATACASPAAFNALAVGDAVEFQLAASSSIGKRSASHVQPTDRRPPQLVACEPTVRVGQVVQLPSVQQPGSGLIRYVPGAPGQPGAQHVVWAASDVAAGSEAPTLHAPVTFTLEVDRRQQLRSDGSDPLAAKTYTRARQVAALDASSAVSVAPVMCCVSHATDTNTRPSAARPRRQRWSRQPSSSSSCSRRWLTSWMRQCVRDAARASERCWWPWCVVLLLRRTVCYTRTGTLV